MKVSLSINKRELDDLLKRFEKAPEKLQRSGTGVALTAGAKVVVQNAKAKAPSCLSSTIKIVNRKTFKKYTKKLSVKVGNGVRANDMFNVVENAVLRKAGSKLIDCPPAHWVEFGTYGNRNLYEDPYAPATLRKKSYASGRSNSKFWSYPNYWIPTKPFMRPALDDPKIEQAMAKRLGEYFDKKGI